MIKEVNTLKKIFYVYKRINGIEEAAAVGDKIIREAIHKKDPAAGTAEPVTK